MGNQSVEKLLRDGNIQNAAITITALAQEISPETVNEFYSLWCDSKTNGILLDEFAQVYRGTGIAPDWPQTIVFVNTVYKVIKNNKSQVNSMRDVIEVCYDLLLKSERPEYFYRFYCCAGLEPPTDFIYQAAMIAKLKNEAALKQKICDTFQIVA